MKSRFAVIFAVIALMIICFQWLLPGIRVATDFPRVSEALLKYSMNLPFVWSETGAEGIGEYSSFFLWNWPLSFTVGILANIGFSFIFLEKYLFITLIFIIGTVGIWRLGKYLHLSNSACLVSTAFYLLNTYLMLLIDGGQLSIALAYAWFPLCFLSLDKAINSKLNFKIFSGIAIAILGFFDVRFIYILIFLGSIRFLYLLIFISKKDLFGFCLKWLKSGIILSLIVLGLHFYWLYPLFKAPLSSQIYQIFTKVSYLSSVNIGHSLLILAPHWFVNVFGKITPLKFEFILIPILVLLAPVLRMKNRDVGFWLAVMVISLFLSKGFSEPFPQIYIWLFNHLPGFSMFRDSTKFFFLVTLSYSVLIGIAIDEISHRLKLLKRARPAILIVFISYLIFLLRPIWFGQMTGIFSSPQFQKEYFQLSTILEKDKAYGRVFWIPFFPPLGYSDLNHPRIEAARATQKRMFAVGTRGTYEIFNYLREASYMGEIFDITGIGYLAYPYLDQRKDDLSQDNIKYYYTFLNQLSERPWLSKVEGSPIPLFKTKQHQGKFFTTANTWWVIGSDSIYNEATTSSHLKLSRNVLIFPEENAGFGELINSLPEAKIVLNNKTYLDLAASMIDPGQLIFPSLQLDFSPNQSGWWKRGTADLIEWRSFLQSKYGIDNKDFDLGGGWAIAEGGIKHQISDTKLQKNDILLARVMESSRSGGLSFYQNNKLIGEIATKNQGTSNIRWFEVGRLNSDKGLIIVSRGDINVVNALAVINQNIWSQYQRRTDGLRNAGRIVPYNERYTSDHKTIVTYSEINPTKYKVNVSGLTHPVFLIFSESFDKLWQMNGKQSLKVYSLLNGFSIDRNGDYIVEFAAQKYVSLGLLVSGSTLLLLLLLLFRLR